MNWGLASGSTPATRIFSGSDALDPPRGSLSRSLQAR